jgi:hypothetical protein
MVFLDLYLKMMFKTHNMENKNQNRNLLLLALAGLGVYYFIKNKKTTAPVVPPTTGGGNVFPTPPQPPRQIVKPVEPGYQAPIYEERDPIYNAPRVDAPIEYTPERGKIDVPPPAIVQAPIYDYVQPPASIWDEPIIYEPIYYAPVVDAPIEYTPERNRIDIPPPAIVQEPIYDRITPVEPIYNEPIYQEQTFQPEQIPYYGNEEYREYGGSVVDFANNIPFIGMLYERDEPIEYDFELKRR